MDDDEPDQNRTFRVNSMSRVILLPSPPPRSHRVPLPPQFPCTVTVAQKSFQSTQPNQETVARLALSKRVK